MPDARKAALDRAVQALRDAGAIGWSVLVTFPGDDTRTALSFPVGKRKGPALGKGLREIVREQAGTGTPGYWMPAARAKSKSRGR